MKKLFGLIALLVLFGVGGHANAQVCVTLAQNCGPPAGSFLDLSITNSDGSGNTTAVPKSYTTFTATFTGLYSLTYLTFALRDDSGFLNLANITLTDTTTHSSNLLLNGDFSLGPVGNSTPKDWLYYEPSYLANGSFSAFTGEVTAACGPTSGNCYSDGSVQGYDDISQGVATTIGDTYQVTFALMDTGTLTTFRRLSNNGNVTDSNGNGIDLLAYQEQAPAWIPEPASMLVVGSGLLGLFASRRRRG